MDVSLTWILTWHQRDHVSQSLGLFLKNHVLEVDLTQNWETMAHRNPIIVDLLYFIIYEDLALVEIH